MSASIFTNKLPDPETRKRVAGSVLAAIGERAGEWTVSMIPDQGNDIWEITVEGPGGFRWTGNFSGSEGEHNTDFIHDAVQKALPADVKL